MSSKKDIKFGVSIPQGLRSQNVDSSAIAPLLAKLESLGFDGCWVGDHPTSRFDLASCPSLVLCRRAYHHITPRYVDIAERVEESDPVSAGIVNVRSSV